MKKALSVLILFSLMAGSKAWSQSCIPNNDTVPGIEPDTLSVAYVNSPYEEVIYFHLPGDTVVDFVIGGDTFEVHLCIDSLTIDSVQGLPDGFSFGCHVPWCSVLGNGNGCAAISGTPAESQIGIHPLDVFVTIYVNDCYGFALPPQVDTVSFYYIDIQPATGIDEQDKSAISTISCYPNPANGTAELLFYQLECSEVTIRIAGLDGKVVYHECITARAGYNKVLMAAGDLPESTYIVQVSSGERTAATKLFITK